MSADKRECWARAIPDGNGGYTVRLLRADAGWFGDYEITDRNDLVNGRV
jgi:hypothetical protein